MIYAQSFSHEFLYLIPGRITLKDKTITVKKIIKKRVSVPFRKGSETICRGVQNGYYHHEEHKSCKVQRGLKHSSKPFLKGLETMDFFLQ